MARSKLLIKIEQMKNLRKLSRESLKKLNGGKLYPGNSGGGGCDDMCKPNGGNGGDGCSQYGLTVDVPMFSWRTARF